MINNHRSGLLMIAISFYLIIGGLISLTNFVYELQYSKWFFKNVPNWFGGGVLAINSACIIVSAIPPQKRGLISNLVVAFLFITTFIFIRPSYQLSPGYIKLGYLLTFAAFIVIRLLLPKGPERESTGVDAQ